jgi:TonB C terminal
VGSVVAKGGLEIGLYIPPTAETVPFAHPPGKLVSRGAVAALGACASLLLHVSLITVFTYGGGHPHQPSQQIPVESAGSALEVVWVESAESGGCPSLDLNAITAASELATVGLDAALDQASDPALSEDSEGDAASSALFGRYVGQIDARIQRAWRRPRDPVEQEIFSCRARIEQNASGAIKEVTLERCNGNSRWQLSLLHAIQQASPLPAPPDPGVFKSVLHLDFRALPYSADSPQELFERPPVP